MKSAPFHPKEARRLEALRDTGLLDSLPSEDFDDATKLASYICGTPIALISLVDEHRQWFKSRVGLETPETPRDTAFCAYTILGTEVFVVPDSRVDDRFSDNPLVTGAPNVIFYAGAPLVTSDGVALGTLCVLDREARSISAAQREALQCLARQVVAQIRLLEQTHKVVQHANELTVVTASLRRTIAQRDQRNADMRLVMDNVGQGLLTIDRAGVISAEHSKALSTWFGPTTPGERFWDYLARVDPVAARDFEIQWIELLEDALPRSLLLQQLPSRIRSGGRTYAVEYTPITDANDTITRLLIMVSDVTAHLAAERAEAAQRDIVTIFETMLRDRSSVVEFLTEAEALMSQLMAATRPPIVETWHQLHTLKGNARMFGLTRLASLCHQIEDRVIDSRSDLSDADRDALATAWRTTAEPLFALLGQKSQGIEIDAHEHAELLAALSNGMRRSEIYRRVEAWTLPRAGRRLERFATEARALSRRLHKGDVHVQIDGADLRLPAIDWRGFWSSLSHVVRNSVDHGIESPDERIARGKGARGLIRLGVALVDGAWRIEISDDGRGIDWAAVARRARRIGLPTAHHDDLVAALFADGVSTRDAVSDISGRGVGLGAAKRACEHLGGHIAVESRPNLGTTFYFYIPAPDSGPPVRPTDSVHASDARTAAAE